MTTISIDVTKIPRDKIIPGKKQRQDGTVGKYVNLVMFANRDGRDQYENDGAVCISQSKEEREAKQPRIYVGNYKESDQPRQSPTSQREEAHLKDKSNGYAPADRRENAEDSDLPF